MRISCQICLPSQYLQIHIVAKGSGIVFKCHISIAQNPTNATSLTQQSKRSLGLTSRRRQMRQPAASQPASNKRHTIDMRPQGQHASLPQPVLSVPKQRFHWRRWVGAAEDTCEGESHMYPTSVALAHVSVVPNWEPIFDINWGIRLFDTNPIRRHPCILPSNSPIERATFSPYTTLQIRLHVGQ